MQRALAFCLFAVIGMGCQKKSLNEELESAGIAAFDPKQVEAIVESQKLELSVRLNEIQSLQEAFRNSYIGYRLKKDLIGFSGDEIFQACLGTEKQYPDRSYNQDFYERLKQCLAKFQDGHLNIVRTNRSLNLLSPISSGAWINGKWLIARVRPALIAKLIELGELSKEDGEAIAAGTQILEIDGVLAEQELLRFENLVAASSILGRRAEAADSYFTRSLLYPKTKTLSLKLLTKANQQVTVTLPWFSFARSGADLLETPMILQNLGVRPTQALEKASELLTSRGFENWKPVFKDLEERHSYISNGDDVLLTGKATIQNQKVCYLQALTFGLEYDENNNTFPIQESANPEKSVNYADVAEQFLSQCDSEGLGLVLDLRDNGGGDAELVEQLTTLFDQPGAPLILRATALSTRPGNIALLQNLQMMNPDPSLNVKLFSDAWLQAVQNQQDISPWIIRKTNDYKSSVFNQKVTVLTGPACYSACENAVARFKSTGRGKIVGNPTHGTGFGFRSFGIAETKWRSGLNSFEVTIPNQAFHNIFADELLIAENGQKGQLVPFEKVMVLENHPTEPDVKYELQEKDLNDFEGYLEFLSQHINW